MPKKEMKKDKNLTNKYEGNLENKSNKTKRPNEK